MNKTEKELSSRMEEALLVGELHIPSLAEVLDLIKENPNSPLPEPYLTVFSHWFNQTHRDKRIIQRGTKSGSFDIYHPIVEELMMLGLSHKAAIERVLKEFDIEDDIKLNSALRHHRDSRRNELENIRISQKIADELDTPKPNYATIAKLSNILKKE